MKKTNEMHSYTSSYSVYTANLQYKVVYIVALNLPGAMEHFLYSENFVVQ